MTNQPAWTAEDIVRLTRGDCLHEQTWHAKRITTDMAALKSGDLFVALTDAAHADVASAIAAGAVAALVTRQPPHAPAQAPLIFVEDAAHALAALAAAARARSGCSLIAAIGVPSLTPDENENMLQRMVPANGVTYNIETSALMPSLANLPPQANYALAAYSAGTGDPYVLRALAPDILAILDENFRDTDIFAALPATSLLVLNRDNPHFSRLASAAKAKGIKRFFSFGQHNKADAMLQEGCITATNISIRARIFGRSFGYCLNTTDPHTAMASLGALLTTMLAGGDRAASLTALGGFPQADEAAIIPTQSAAISLKQSLSARGFQTAFAT
jgi:UDP-N-acetylmuramoyl-tripeptide--D-alanyl-D-alanine ligase